MCDVPGRVAAVNPDLGDRVSERYGRATNRDTRCGTRYTCHAHIHTLKYLAGLSVYLEKRMARIGRNGGKIRTVRRRCRSRNGTFCKAIEGSWQASDALVHASHPTTGYWIFLNRDSYVRVIRKYATRDVFGTNVIRKELRGWGPAQICLWATGPGRNLHSSRDVCSFMSRCSLMS